ncbi:hypothetical protein CLV63_13359 [Murinocardiopsis flavida]|uniref:Uncharacterized protein n=1 Tax=Murinocardiopsis flavida TaxID=645275 RepID=A0A2P8CPR9_9ACTN|nr:hypothetical protein CLV63_13359 [Murinocardiopsis flavida]
MNWAPDSFAALCLAAAAGAVAVAARGAIALRAP